MPLGHKNAGVTYQRLMYVVLLKKIWRNLEVYIDDMIVKTLEREIQVTDLEDIPGSIRFYNMHLNPTKFSFGIQLTSKKIIGFYAHQKRHRGKPKKLASHNRH